jgi:hypothetical protein
MRPIRLVTPAMAAILLAAGCGGDSTAGSGSPAGNAVGSSAAPSPSPSSNGVADLSAKEILSKATAALKSAKAVRIKGQSRDGSERIVLDMAYSGDDSAGTIAVSGQKLELRKIGKTAYIKGSRGFWTDTGGEAAAQLLTGKWLKAPVTDQRYGPIAELTDLDKAAEGILEPDGEITKGGRKTVNGVEAIALVEKGTDGGTLYVATTGQPYPLQLASSAESTEQATVNFLDYGKTVTVAVPPADTVIDVTKLPSS